MKMRRTKAIVIRRTNYQEADRILQLLTPEYGVISVIARGARREKSKLAGGIELFARCEVTIGDGKGSLGILTSSRLEQFYGNILHDYERLQFGYETIKQVSKAADVIDEPTFFDLLDQAFGYLHDEAISLLLVKIWFWLQLAILLGVGMNLSTDNHGMKLVEDTRYDFDNHDSVFIFRENGRFSSQHIKLLRLLSAQSPRVAMQVQGVGDLLVDCALVAEQAVAH